MAKVISFHFQRCCYCLFVLLLNSWCCEARLAQEPPSNDATSHQHHRQHQQQQEQQRRRLAPCSEEAHQCLPAGIGYTMHTQSFFQSCTELCMPTFLTNLRYNIGWKCGPCTVQHQGTSSVYNAIGKDKVVISRPSQSTANDLLLLFLSRTDDLLPLRLDGWTPGPACLKTENHQEECHVVKDCIKWDGDYCLEFGYSNATAFSDMNRTLDGLDLGTAVFYRIVQPDEPSQYTFNLHCANETFQCQPSWAILTAVRNANNENPIGDTATEANDGIPESRFPSVYGEAGDMLFLHMALDDGYTTGTNLLDVLPPGGTGWLEQVIGEDEAGYLFFEDLESSGETGARTTAGFGAPPMKDVMISLIVRKKL